MSERQEKKITPELKLKNYWENMFLRPGIVRGLIEDPEETIAGLLNRLPKTTEISEADFRRSLIGRIDRLLPYRRQEIETLTREGLHEDAAALEANSADLQTIRDNFSSQEQAE